MFIYRILLLGDYSSADTPKETPYRVIEFARTPGVHFDKVGRMHPTESIWKYVIKIDTITLHTRIEILTSFAKRQEKLCESQKMDSTVKDLCKTLNALIRKEINHAQQLTRHIDTIYGPNSDKKRGLINGIGTLAKSLFGVMDANDDKIIHEQLALVENNQNVLKHVVTNQLHVLNASLNHIKNLEGNIQNNENLLVNITQRIRQNQASIVTREEMDEHYVILNAMVTTLIREIEDTVEYVLYLKNGMLHPRLAPIEQIMDQLKKTILHLAPGMHFPFKIDTQNWLEIEKFVTISAYRSKSKIFTVMNIPLIMYPAYDILNIIPLPTHSHDNIYAMTEVAYTKLAIREDGNTYILMTDELLKECKQSGNAYVCPPNYPIYKITQDATCEVQIYTQKTRSPTNCNTRYVKINHTLIIALRNTHEWLYSTHVPQMIHISCKKGMQYKEILNKTGLLRLKQSCEAEINDIKINVPETMDEGELEIYLPDYNMTLPALNTEIMEKIPETKLKKVVNDPDELSNAGSTLEKINENLKSPHPFFQEHIIIPTISVSTIVTIVVIILIIYVIRKLRSNITRDIGKIHRSSIEIRRPEHVTSQHAIACRSTPPTQESEQVDY